jgi:hypothetical protein
MRRKAIPINKRDKTFSVGHVKVQHLADGALAGVGEHYEIQAGCSFARLTPENFERMAAAMQDLRKVVADDGS